MTESPAEFHSMAGVAESAEPTSMPSTTTTTNSSTTSVNTIMRHHSNGKRPLHVSGSGSGSPSTANSPQTSRESSPARPVKRTNTGGSITTSSHSTLPPKASRMSSRKSSTDVSPNRANSLAGPNTSSSTPTPTSSTTTVPSAAAIQRALSSTSIPSLPPSSAATQDSSRVPRPSNTPSANNSGNSTPHWPVSPRFKSPPPPDSRSRSRRNSLRTQPQPQQQPQKKPEPPTPNPPAIVVQSSSPGPVSRLAIVKDETVLSETDEPLPTMKAVSRGASGAPTKLETVQEFSQPTTPACDEDEAGSLSSTPTGPKLDDARPDILSLSSKITEDLSAKLSKPAESGSDNGIASKSNNKGKMQEIRSASTAAQRSLPLSNKPSLASLSNIRARNEPPLRNMTVETETVPSVAQPTLGTDRSTSGRVDGSLRLKPSNETIRPKKERKPAKRKAPSINSSSKADVFEQKVATAVDEADSSDSDATFIYESNPPEQPHRSRHHHSRTPSMTSIASLHERLALRETHKNPNKKSSMKFANPYNNANGDLDGDRDGTVRVGSGRISGGSHHHHIGRHGQGRGTLSHMMDSDSSMPQSSRARGPSSRQPSQPNSPRFHTFSVGNGSSNGNGTKKHGEYSTYDIDTENAADDERTPLIASRSPRVRTPRRRNSATLRPRDHRHRSSGGWCRKFAGCLVLVILLLVIIFSAVGLVFATTKPLTQLEVSEIQNVIASPEQIILDLVVEAINPNIIGVTVADMDVIIFAKSKHVGSDKWWREHGHKDEDSWLPPIKASEEVVVARDGVDHGTDPIQDGEPHIMSLGRIFHFDAPLNFDGTFFKHRRVESIGEIRLSKPGNKTEAGGTERWEEVLQYPFELIVRGFFNYQLPLSTTERRVPITATYYYDPDAEKKRLKVIEEEKKRQNNLLSTLVSSMPVGRFDRRALPLRLDSQ